MLTLNECGNENSKEIKQFTEDEISDEFECLHNHLDEKSLMIETLSDSSKYVPDFSVFYSLRERF